MNKMNYYYDVRNGFINKYKVFLDDEGLKKLRNEIIERCSFISHIEVECNDADLFYHYYPLERNQVIANFKSKLLKKEGGHTFFKKKDIKNIYLIEYDFYTYSNLILIIDDLLINDNVNVIDKLINCDWEMILKKDSGKEGKVIDTLEIEKSYLEDVKKCIFLSLYDQLEIDRFEEIRDFFNETNTNKNVSSCLKKVLKRDN